MRRLGTFILAALCITLCASGWISSASAQHDIAVQEEMKEARKQAVNNWMDQWKEQHFQDQQDRRVCPLCKGSGSIKDPCTVCSGSGACQACGGRGRKVTSMNRQGVHCLLCRGTGKCKACAGSGATTRKCERCGGTGYLPVKNGESIDNSGTPANPPSSTPSAEPTPQPTPAPRIEPTPTTPPPAPSTPSATPTPSSGSIGGYMDSMRQLDELYKQQEIEEATFRNATLDPAKYLGKVLRSEVFILDGNPRGVLAGTAEYPPQNEMRILTSQKREVGVLVWDFMRNGKCPRKATVTYGIQSPENFVLFHLTPSASGSPQGGT